MVDMSQFVQPKSDQFNADDLIAGPRTITIRGVKGTGSAEQPVAIYFEGDNNKPYKPCKSMARVMIAAWGPDAATYAGRSMTLYRDAEVVFGGMKVGGIRISHMSHIDGTLVLALTVTKAKRAPYKVLPIKAQVPRESKPPAMAEASAGFAPHVEPAEVAAAGSEAALFDAPDYVEQAASLDVRYRACSDMDSLRQLWADTAAERRAIISADGSYKDVFAKVIAREKARLEGEME